MFQTDLRGGSVEKQFDYFPVVSLKASCNQFPWFKDR